MHLSADSQVDVVVIGNVEAMNKPRAWMVNVNVTVHLRLEAQDCGSEEKYIWHTDPNGIAVFDPNIIITLLASKHNTLFVNVYILNNFVDIFKVKKHKFVSFFKIKHIFWAFFSLVLKIIYLKLLWCFIKLFLQ